MVAAFGARCTVEFTRETFPLARFLQYNEKERIGACGVAIPLPKRGNSNEKISLVGLVCGTYSANRRRVRQ